MANPQCMVGAFLQEQQIREVFPKIVGENEEAAADSMKI